MGTEPTAYPPEFFESIRSGSDSSAAVVVPLLFELLGPIGSVVDVGCGSGLWLQRCQVEGATDILGMDGPWVDVSSLAVPLSSFRVTELRDPPPAARSFDLVISLEVAEHLPPTSADRFVRFLTSLGHAVAFSAAIPGQGGQDHLNEQWPTYWAERFEAQGFVGFDVVRPAIWTDDRVEPWYRQNLIVFVDRTKVDRYPKLSQAGREILALVHPEIFHAHLRTTKEVLMQPLTVMRGHLRPRRRLRAMRKKS